MTIHITVTGQVTVNQLDPTTVVGPILDRLTALETTLMSQFSDLRDNLTAVFADLAAKLDRLQEAVDNADSETHLTPEDQTILDDIVASVAAARTTVGDENADGIPSAG